MKTIISVIYRIYQLCIALPLGLLSTVITAVVTAVGSMVGNGNFWGYYPGRLWSKSIINLLLLPVGVEGREHLADNQSYVFVANHQGAFDIFLIYGYLGRNFKWMLKQSLRKIPFVGFACEKARFVFVDKSSPSAIRRTYEQARQTLQGGTSLMVFPEGSRTFTGRMTTFKRGAFMLADELQLPVVPITINGSFDVLPRTRGVNFVERHRLTLSIHEPIMPSGQGADNIQNAMKRSRQVIQTSLAPEYRDKESAE